MDFLCRRYGGSPFFILDGYMEQHRFHEFVHSVWEIHNDEELFDIWLHKIDDKSYQDFKDSVIPRKPIGEKEIADTIRESSDILEGFTLKEG